MKKLFLGITGASGVEFGIEMVHYSLQNHLNNEGWELHVCFSRGFFKVLEYEMYQNEQSAHQILQKYNMVEPNKIYVEHNVTAGPASGSFGIDAAIILPCSMNTLGHIAHGFGDNLITRAVSVCLKERRPVILCTRETPLARQHIQNMLTAHDSGCTIMPIQHGYYSDHKIENVDLYKEHVRMNFIGRVLQHLHINSPFHYVWTGQ